ncbi:MAG TPA: Trp family transcriptional regulator [Anaerohalosphaeraceae bacterium]|nr:helix-turn-helix domain-containing protein [Phycisphaerae bacterium]HOL32151.1 Trp family transcriptional regulator [Anaerohalosphaeraceae bacterium]HOM77098.1 Trp family transcriptional regulator [Anaerohalosphaeraceae bacterium]HPC65105.1 Trp family transcriptional regulator [Anaerohalosphaeraceae bacterium]HPO70903.1 Trp family transcriptional regulator [Anaerohalosphaeraceae bacterium]
MSRNKREPEKSCIDDLCSVLCDIRQPEQMRIFLDEILTPAERKDLSLRWQLMKMLQQGFPQRQIAAQLGVSLCKITRGAKILKNNQSVSKQYLIAGDKNGPKDSTK